MPIQANPFDPQKIGFLKTVIERSAAANRPKFYEIFVDNLKVVSKTDNPAEFDAYEDYFSPSTNSVEVVIYNTGHTPRNDRYIFRTRANTPQEALLEGLNGLNERTLSKKDMLRLKSDIETRVAESEKVQKLEAQIEQLKAEKTELERRNEDVEKLVEKLNAQRNTIHGIDLTRIATGALENLVRNNTEVIAKLPGLEGLAGAIDEDTRIKNETIFEESGEAGEVNFKRRDTASPKTGMSQAEQDCFDILKILREKFTQEELIAVCDLLQYLSEDKNRLAQLQQFFNANT